MIESRKIGTWMKLVCSKTCMASILIRFLENKAKCVTTTKRLNISSIINTTPCVVTDTRTRIPMNDFIRVFPIRI